MRLAKQILIAVGVFAALAGGRADAQTARKPAPPRETYTRLTSAEIGLLLAEIRESNPELLKKLEDDAEMRRSQIEALRQLLAFASEAQKTGLADQTHHRRELENIRAEVVAINYDRHLNKAKPAVAPFGNIGESAVAGYWGDVPGSKMSAAVKAGRKAKFEEFLDTKIHFLRAGNSQGQEVTPEERNLARDFYAKIQIYADEYAKRSAQLPLSFKQKVQLQVKLQEAQFLARSYAEKIAPQITASDEEIADYLKKHPQWDTTAQRAKAQKILDRAKAGEDFAKLADELTEDPGNKNAQGELQGGLYKDVPKGVMVPSFEQGALALEPGQVGPELIESDYGFHIVKLERKSAAEPITYDVRHILISTAAGDPSNPNARPTTIKEQIRKEIETEKEKAVTDRLAAANKISVPADFGLSAAAAKPAEPAAVKPAAKPKKRAVRKRP